jgi:cysteine desulfurase
MLPWLKDEFFNPSSAYREARGPRDAIERARESVARLLGVGAKTEVLFTAGATEGNNAALWGTLRANPERRHVIVSKVEHPAVLEVAREIERAGYRVTWLSVDGAGRLDVRELIHALTPDTALVSLMMANNETGVIFPIADLARIVKRTDPAIVFHTDATQAVGKLPVDLTRDLADVDLLTLSGHKLHGPKGIGVLFVRRGIRWRPYLLGGHQERGRRAGTENVPGIVGLGVACELARAHAADAAHELRLQQRLEREVTERIPHVLVNGGGAPRLPNTTNVSFEYVEGEGILFALNEHGICASSGSACTSGSLDPSHVLKAMGVPFTAVHGSLRLSTSRYTTDADLDTLLDVLPGVIASLRRMSPYWDQDKNAPKAGVEVFVQPKYKV